MLHLIMSARIDKGLNDELHRLAPEQRKRVLDFVRALRKAEPSGVAGKQLTHFAGRISSDDLAAISEAVTAGCEQISANEW